MTALQIVKKHASTIQLVAAMLLLAVAILYTFAPIFSYDLHWHMANGRAILETGQIVEQELFSFTAPGAYFHNHEWLSQIIFEYTYATWGALGLFILKFSLYSISLLFLFHTLLILMAGDRQENTTLSLKSPAMRGNALIASLLVLAAIDVGLFRYILRPQIFSLLLVSALGFLLYGFRHRYLDKRWLVLLPVMMVVWDFLHGALYGLSFLLGFVVAENLKPWLPAFLTRIVNPKALDRESLKWLNLAFALTLIAMLISPFGLRSYDVFVELMRDNIMFEINQEFLPANLEEHWPFFMALGTMLIILLFRWRQTDLTTLAILIPFMLLTLRYSRVVGVFGIFFAHAAALHLAPTAQQRQQQDSPRPLALIIIVSAAVFLVGHFIYVKFMSTNNPFRFGYTMLEEYHPVGSARFVMEHGIRGRMYNSGKYGGYLSYTLFPERKIFKFNHPYVFGSPDMHFDSPDDPQRWNIDYAIVGNSDELVRAFPIRDWAPLYREPAAVLLVNRHNPAFRELINRYEVRWFSPMMSLEQMQRRVNNPRTYPSFIREMGIHLRYRREDVLAKRFAEWIHQPGSVPSQQEREALLEGVRVHNDIMLR